MAKSDELVKYITEQVINFVETPREVRREHSRAKESWGRRWFGMIPFSISLWAKQLPKPGRNKAEERQSEAHSRGE